MFEWFLLLLLLDPFMASSRVPKDGQYLSSPPKIQAEGKGYQKIER